MHQKTIRSNALDAMVLKTLKIQMELFCDAQQVLERLSKKQPKFPAHTEENELQQLEQQVKRKQGYATSLYADYRTGLLTREEYTRLVCAAETAGRTRLALLLETICATGIRVSELISLDLRT